MDSNDTKGYRTPSFGMIEQVSRFGDNPRSAIHFRLEHQTNSIVLSREEAERLRDTITHLLEAESE